MPETFLQKALTQKRPNTSASPLLFIFMIPVLGLVGLLVWLSADLTWVVVGVAMVALAVMTFVVILTITRLTSDDLLDD